MTHLRTEELRGTKCGGDVAESGAGVMLALESPRGLSEVRLECVCADEAAAFVAAKWVICS